MPSGARMPLQCFMNEKPVFMIRGAPLKILREDTQSGLGADTEIIVYRTYLYQENPHVSQPMEIRVTDGVDSRVLLPFLP